MTAQPIRQAQADLRFINTLIQAPGRPARDVALTPINGGLLTEGTGQKMIVNFCSDGVYCRNQMAHLWKWVPQSHVHPCNGGAIVLHPETPCRDDLLHKSFYDIYGFGTVYQMQMSLKLGKGQKVIVMAHNNCGVAGLFGLNAKAVLLHTIAAARYVAAQLGISEKRVVALYTVDFTPEREDVAKKLVRTYHFTKNSESLVHSRPY